MKTLRPCLAEFIGTFFLCFAGIAAILSNTASVGGMSGLLGIALAHGLALSIAVNAFGGIYVVSQLRASLAGARDGAGR